MLNCVNVTGTEAPSTLLCAERGTIVYFSMATNFGSAVLTTDPVGIDVDVLFGAGVFVTQPDEAYGSLRRNYALYSAFAVQRDVHQYMPSVTHDFNESHLVRFLPNHFADAGAWRHDMHGWYRRVHVWSTTDIGAFWSRVWDYCGIIGHKGNGPYYVPPSAHAPLSDARFFPAASACLAENLLRYARTEPGRVALIACSEQSGDGTSALTQPPRWRATLRRGCQAARAGGGQG